MPIPKPQSGETHDEFNERCMADPMMIDDYDDEGQRFAVCQSQWDENKAEKAMNFLEAIRQRSAGNISTADRYLRSIETCFEGGMCPTRIFEKATSAEWKDALQEAESRFVYNDSDMEVKECRTKGPAGMYPGAILEFDAVITTTRKDRDGDILETKGATVDTKMPLLWQHMPFEPIGKYLATNLHTEKLLEGKFAIADTTLGRDAAVLTEFGALRISHGFEPTDFEPLEGKDDGYRVNKFHILETSLVSVPSNVDAEILAFSRGKLHHPLVKAYAEKKFQARPVQGIGFETKQDCTCGTKGTESTPIGPVGPVKPSGPVGPGSGTQPVQPPSKPKSADESIQDMEIPDEVVPVEKADTPEEIKRGRTISAKNEESLREAVSDLKEVSNIENVPRAAKTLVGAALRRISGVLEKLGSDSDEGKTYEDLETSLFAMAITEPTEVIEETYKQLSALVESKRQLDEEREFDELLELV